MRSNSVKIELSLHLKTRGNTRRHWRYDWARTKTERESTALHVGAKIGRMSKRLPPAPLPTSITITRCGPRQLDAFNLDSAMKGVIDGIADAYGVDDGDPRWASILKRAQENTKAYAVRIEIAGAA